MYNPTLEGTRFRKKEGETQPGPIHKESKKRNPFSKSLPAACANMTQIDIDIGRLVCEIGVAAMKPEEFAIFRIAQKTGGSE